MAKPAESTSRMPNRPAARHGLEVRGLEGAAMPGFGYGRFGRMFSFAGRQLSEACLEAIAEAMIKKDAGAEINVAEPVDENPVIPAGYTYFGQFVDHDLTLDPTSISVRAVDVAALEDFRTPALDLDCVYGRGPEDQPYMYTDGLHLRLGSALTADGAAVATARDVLRLPEEDGRAPAILGDKRNDENRLVVQIQSLFIAFHNKVVDDRALIEAFGGDFSDDTSRFRTAVQIVRWHYQWLVVNDFLERILSPTTIDQMWRPGSHPDLGAYNKDDARFAYIPVEFAGAAYRFGHSMIRPSYALNREVGVEGTRIPIFSDREEPFANLNGFGVVTPSNWGVDWSFFFDGVPKANLSALPQPPVVPQPSYRIDANLVDPLALLPEFLGKPSPFRNLAFRNLLRGVTNLRLASGEQVARAYSIVPMTPEQLWSVGSQRMQPDTLTGEAKEAFEEATARRKTVYDRFVDKGGELRGATPLWYYILREAEFYGFGRATETEGEWGGQFLGPVGSRIVAQTFLGLLWRDSTSYMRVHPLFEPHETIAGGAPFTLGRLANWVFG